MSPPDDLDCLSHAELKGLVLKLLEEMAELRRTVAAQRDEIARLKGGSGRPNIKPSGMEKASEPKPARGSGEQRRGRGETRSKLVIHAEEIVQVVVPPQGSRFKGYTSYVVQDLVIRTYVTHFRCERWQSPDGKVITAPLPAGVSGHFGPELRRFVLAQYHQGQVTVPRLLALLQALGIVISKRQLMRLLIADHDCFLEEARDVLRAGLGHAIWITVDDTGARHKAANGFCTQIGNAHFTWFGSTDSKSRINFLELMRAGHSDYVISDEALAYMRQRALSGPVVARLAEHPNRFFPDQAAWNVHLDQLGISALKVNPDPVTIATEGALWGSIKAHDFLPNTVIVSDDAGQFNVGQHALCWVHAERLIHKLDIFTDEQREAQRKTRDLVWRFYRDLKVYRQNPSKQRKAALRARFDRIFTRNTGFITLDRLLKRLHANKSELLMVLDRPEIPLNTNGSENDIRCQVTKRKVSAGTRSDAGRDCRDAFLGLSKTCKDKALVLSVNSRERSDRGRALLSKTLGGLVGQPLVEMQSIEQLRASQNAPLPSKLNMSEEERSAIIHDSLDRHYRDLLDQPMPMLGNKSPRAAVRTAKGRGKVADWLKTLENHTAKLADRNGEIANYSFNWIWTELGVAELKR